MRLKINSVFEENSYKKFLNSHIRSLPKGGHGVRLRLAEALSCQSTYVSQVLRGVAHFSLEQADVVARFFELTEAESEYFLLLVQEERAGTRELRAHFRRLRDRALEARKKLQTRFSTAQTLTAEDQARYYSAWYFSAIHVLLTIPGFRDASKISSRLQLSTNLVAEALDFLESAGLAKKERGEYCTGDARLYLGSDSPLISKLHQNWRLRTMQHLDRAHSDDLHYSTVVTLSKKDSERIRESLVKAISAARDVIQQSKEEKLCSFCVDFFEL